MKRWTMGWVACMLMLMVFLTACGGTGSNGNSEGNENANSNANDPASESSSDTESASKPVTIKFYSHEKNDPNEPFQQAVNAFNEMQSEIVVENISLVQNANIDEYVEKLDVLMAAGEQVDGMFLTQNYLQSHAALGVLEPLDGYFEENGINPEDEYFMNPTKDGKQYGMMLVASPWLVMFNEDHLKEAGLPLPDFGWTWEDFREYAKVLTKGEGDDKRYGTFFPTWTQYANAITYIENPNPYLTEDLKPRYGEESFKYFFELRRAMEEEDKSVKPHAEILATNPNIWADYFNGDVSMYLTGSFGLKYTLHNDTFPHTFKTVYAPVPQREGAEAGLTIMSGDYLAMSASSKHKEETYTFLRWLSTEGAIYIPKQSAWKAGDGVENVKRLVGDNTDVVDVDSLVHVLFDERVKTAGPTQVSVPYENQLGNLLGEGLNKFLLDRTTAEEAQQFMLDEAEKIMNQ